MPSFTPIQPVLPLWSDYGRPPSEGILEALRLTRGYTYRSAATEPTDGPVDCLPILGDDWTIAHCEVEPSGKTTNVIAHRSDAAVGVRSMERFSEQLQIVIWAKNKDRATSLVQELLSRAPLTQVDEHRVGDDEVSLLVHNRNDRYNRTLTLPRWADVAANYAASVRTAMDGLLDQIPPDPRGPRLVVLYGPPGTGKTWIARALLREAAERDIDLRLASDPTDVNADLFSDFAALGTKNNWELCLVEDADHLLVPDPARRNYGASLLLNGTDGLLAETLQVLWVLTTNLTAARIDPAMTRPGRALAAIEVPALSTPEANTWLTANGHETTVMEPTTLAELYQHADQGPVTARAVGATAAGYV